MLVVRVRWLIMKYIAYSRKTDDYLTRTPCCTFGPHLCIDTKL